MDRQPCQAYLAIDLGAESGRALIGTLRRERVELQEVHRFANEPIRLPSGLHWDVPGLGNQVREALRKAAAWSAGRGMRLASVGVDTWGVDFGLIDASGELLGPPHCYRDERHAPAATRVVEIIGHEALYAATGLQNMPFNTLFQLFGAHRASPKLLDAADRLLFIPDLMHDLLCGQSDVEATIASTSQMIDARGGQWSCHSWSALAAGPNWPARCYRAGRTQDGLGRLRPGDGLPDVFRPDGYRLSDFIKIGLPMSLLWFATSMVLILTFCPL